MEFWPNEFNQQEVDRGYSLEVRASIALSMIDRHGLIVGASNREDSQGRAVIEAMSAQETVKRAFELADYFVATCEARGLIKKAEKTLEDLHVKAGELNHIRFKSM